MSSTRLRPAWLALSLVAGSLSNVTVIFGTAWTGRAAAVGAVAALLAAYVLVLCVARGLLGEWLLLKRNDRPGIDEDIAGAAVILGVVAGCVSLPVMVLVLPDEASAAVVVAVAFPILMLQDALRYVSISRGLAHHAAASDVLWLLCGLLATTWCLSSGRGQTVWLLGAWAAGGAAGGGLLLALCRLRPRFRALHSFLREEGALRLNLTADALLTTGTLSLSILLSASVIGLDGVGVIRFLQTLFGPITLLFGVLYVEFATRSRRGADPLAPYAAAVRMAFMLTAATLGISILLLAAPRILGDSGGGELLEASLAVLTAFSLSQVAAGFGTAAATGLKLADRSGAAAKIRAAWAVGIVGGALLGGAFAGVAGYIWFTTVVHLFAAVAWWRQLAATRPHPHHELT
jgi:hypothetical protein